MLVSSVLAEAVLASEQYSIVNAATDGGPSRRATAARCAMFRRLAIYFISPPPVTSEVGCVFVNATAFSLNSRGNAIKSRNEA